MRLLVCDATSGNVRSVVRAAERAADAAGVACEVVTSSDPDEIRRADALVVPGQGAFGAFARALEGGLGGAAREAIERGAPYLGICLGLQVLFERSEEAEGARGLGLFAGSVRKLAPGADGADRALVLPHVGWNLATPAPGSWLLDRPAHAYFAHSFAAEPADEAIVAARATYGAATFVAAVAKDNVAGVQFHPEKSQRVGAAVLQRWIARAARAGGP